ncbi:Thioredoxin-disulfide reductase [Streptococcus thermophilus CNCM I-1630]|nr:Thioredoxin-disulfide reductase [Streptococcus thermophilus CNCM I-1630]
MAEEKIEDITMIGGGPVRLWAAFYAGIRGMTVNIIESLSELGGQPAILYPEKKIYDIPAFPQTTGAELIENLLIQLKRFEDRVSIHLKEEVQTFKKTDGIFTIATSKGQHLSKAIVMACGNGGFCSTSFRCGPMKKILRTYNLLYNVHSLDQFAGKKVVIAGGGDSAVDWANHLDGVAESVTLIHRRDAFRAHEHSVELLYQSSVNVMTPYVPLEIKGENGHAQSLTVQRVSRMKL